MTLEDATAELHRLRLNIVVNGEGDYVIAQFPESHAPRINIGQPVSIYMGNPLLREENEVKVPDFSGKTIPEVASVVDQLGLILNYYGFGTVYDQDINPGSIINRRAIINIRFR
jgi:beta-lactam-binding protein with PASTA domain